MNERWIKFHLDLSSCSYLQLRVSFWARQTILESKKFENKHGVKFYEFMDKYLLKSDVFYKFIFISDSRHDLCIQKLVCFFSFAAN